MVRVRFAFFAAFILFATRVVIAQNNLPTPGSGGCSGITINSHAKPFESDGLPDSAITFFNPSIPSIDLYAGVNYNTTSGQDGVIGFGEWFHLPQSSGGYVDSVTVVMDSTSADTIFAALFQAWTLDAYPYYTPNPSRYYAAAFVKGTAIHGPSRVTFAFNHTQVPQDFVVGIEPNVNYSAGNYYWVAIRADSEQPQVRTVKNTRSNFIYVGGYNTYYGQVLDSVLIPYNTTSPIYSNFDITTYVPSSGSASVSPGAPSSSIELFPNPANARVSCECSPQVGLSQIELFDPLGRRVLTQSCTGSTQLDVTKLAPGRYEAICSTAQGVATLPVLIER